MVALPDHLAVLVGGVPDLGAVQASAVPAIHDAGEEMNAAVAVRAGLSGGDLLLHQIEGLRADDGLVVTLHIVLRHLPGVLDLLLGDEVLREHLLQQSVTLVFLVCQNAQDNAFAPDGLAAGRRDAVGSQVVGDGIGGVAPQELCVNAADNLRLFFVDHQVAVRPPVVAQESAEGHRNLAVGKALALTPGAVLGNAAALLLGQRGHDRQHQLALAVEGPDVLLLKVNLDALVLELADGGQAVDGVAGEAGDALGDNQVDLPVERIVYHALEALAPAGVAAGFALVRVYGNKLPVRASLDVVGVIIDLRLIAGELLVLVRGNTGVGSNPASGARDRRPGRMQRNGGGDHPDVLCHCASLPSLKCNVTVSPGPAVRQFARARNSASSKSSVPMSSATTCRRTKSGYFLLWQSAHFCFWPMQYQVISLPAELVRWYAALQQPHWILPRKSLVLVAG